VSSFLETKKIFPTDYPFPLKSCIKDQASLIIIIIIYLLQ